MHMGRSICGSTRVTRPSGGLGFEPKPKTRQTALNTSGLSLGILCEAQGSSPCLLEGENLGTQGAWPPAQRQQLGERPSVTARVAPLPRQVTSVILSQLTARVY